LKAAADFFTGYIKDISGKSLLQNAQKSKRIELRLAKTTGIGVEGYLLDVSPVAIVVTANTKAGIVYAMQTLFQTLPAVRTNAPLAGFLHGRTTAGLTSAGCTKSPSERRW
jgi:hexosaminidase